MAEPISCVLWLAGGAFAIGTGTLIITGILPDLSAGLGVSVDTAGLADHDLRPGLCGRLARALDRVRQYRPQDRAGGRDDDLRSRQSRRGAGRRLHAGHGGARRHGAGGRRLHAGRQCGRGRAGATRAARPRHRPGHRRHDGVAHPGRALRHGRRRLRRLAPRLPARRAVQRARPRRIAGEAALGPAARRQLAARAAGGRASRRHPAGARHDHAVDHRRLHALHLHRAVPRRPCRHRRALARSGAGRLRHRLGARQPDRRHRQRPLRPGDGPSWSC